MKLNEISVSRKHANISIEGQDFYIEDMNSKYGTLILVNSKTHQSLDFNLDSGNICFQYGATLLTIDTSKRLQTKEKSFMDSIKNY